MQDRCQGYTNNLVRNKLLGGSWRRKDSEETLEGTGWGLGIGLGLPELPRMPDKTQVDGWSKEGCSSQCLGTVPYDWVTPTLHGWSSVKCVTCTGGHLVYISTLAHSKLEITSTESSKRKVIIWNPLLMLSLDLWLEDYWSSLRGRWTEFHLGMGVCI